MIAPEVLKIFFDRAIVFGNEKLSATQLPEVMGVLLNIFVKINQEKNF